MFKKLRSKDNFWNLMFWVGMVFGSILADSFDPSIGGIIFWMTIIGVSWFIKRKQNLSINSDNVFVNSQGQLLNDRYPIFVILVIIASVLFRFLFSLSIDNFLQVDTTAAGMSLILITLPLTLYFIKLNCPISIMFHASGWREEITGWRMDSNTPRTKPNFLDSHNIHKPSPLQSFMRENPITDPRWSGSSSNIHHSSRR